MPGIYQHSVFNGCRKLIYFCLHNRKVLSTFAPVPRYSDTERCILLITRSVFKILSFSETSTLSCIPDNRQQKRSRSFLCYIQVCANHTYISIKGVGCCLYRYTGQSKASLKIYINSSYAFFIFITIHSGN